MFRITAKGNTKKTQNFLKRVNSSDLYKGLESLAVIGVSALSSATPRDRGTTAASWGYSVEVDSGGARIIWTNSHINDGVNIAIILQYGHGTGTGGYVAGVDYINPAIRPIFESISNEVWKRVKSA